MRRGHRLLGTVGGWWIASIGLRHASSVAPEEGMGHSFGTGSPVPVSAAAPHSKTKETLHGLYRRLRKEGECKELLQKSISIHPIDSCIAKGVQMLRLHKELVDTNRQLAGLRWFQLLRRLRLICYRRQLAFGLFRIRLTENTLGTLSDVLVLALFVTVIFLLYEIYAVCRVGVNRAEQRYRSLAIPVMQTFAALEAVEERKKTLQKQMESDILHQRAA